MKNQMLTVYPENGLKFEGVFKSSMTKKLTLKNPTDKLIAFKIKTTTPKQYCVRPSLGLIEPKTSKDISIVLQPLTAASSEVIRHKFLIQSLLMEQDNQDSTNLEALWKSAPADDIMHTKMLSLLVYKEQLDVSTPDAENDTTEEPISFKTLGDQSESRQNGEGDQRSDDGSSSPITESGRLSSTAAGDGAVSGDTDTQEESGEANSAVVEENRQLKTQVTNLKKMLFDNTYRLESLQLQQQQLSQQQQHKLEQNRSGDKSSDILSSLGLPIVAYLLLAFFIGLIIGKFFL